MHRSLAPLALVALSVPAAAQTDDVARILPADAAVLVRLESGQSWNDLAHALAPLVGEGAAGFDMQKTLDGMASDEADPATLPRLDPARPLFLAVTFDPGSGPGLTFAVPVSNGQPFRIHETFGTTKSTVVGNYAAITTLPEFVPSPTPNVHLAALRPGLVSVRVDLGALIATFRPLIEMGLAQAEAALDELPSEGMSFDFEPMMEAYLDAARDLLDSARTLDLALERSGEELSFRGDYTEAAERMPAGARADVGPMLGLLDPTSPVQVAFNGTWTDSLELFGDFVDAALDVYPEPLRSDMGRLLDQQRALGPLLAPGMVASFDLGPAGLRADYFLRASEPERLAAALEELMRTMDHEGGLVRVGAAERLVVDELEARVLPVEIRYESLEVMLAHVDPGAVEEAEVDEAFRRMREGLQAIYGERLRLALAWRGDVVGVCVAANDSELRVALARLTAPALPDPRLPALLANVEAGATGFAYHIDFGRIAGRLAAAMQALTPETVAFPDLDASLDFWGSLHGSTWSGGTMLSLAELTEFARSVRELGK
jgi:hypothetical protein